VDRAGCLIVVPYLDSILTECEDGLRALEKRGYVVRRDAGPDAIDHKRSRLATQALEEPYEEFLWIDSDMKFDPDDVDRLRSHGLPLVGGFYAGRGKPDLSCRPLAGTTEIAFGQGGSPVEVHSLATGFLLTHRRVYEDIVRKLDLPWCGAASGELVVPYFLPLVYADQEHGMAYLSEDYAFCQRARQAGHKVMLDASIRLWHVGHYGYGWEDVGSPIPRVVGGTMKIRRR
jgi:hypothetical protein